MMRLKSPMAVVRKQPFKYKTSFQTEFDCFTSQLE